MSIETPCKKICVLDLQRDVCEGCGRTRAEIGGWLNMTAAQRRAVMAQLPDRLGAIERARTAETRPLGVEAAG
jgi:predicted Fe-S protein YdhL (DUF1289 family)